MSFVVLRLAGDAFAAADDLRFELPRAGPRADEDVDFADAVRPRLAAPVGFDADDVEDFAVVRFFADCDRPDARPADDVFFPATDFPPPVPFAAFPLDELPLADDFLLVVVRVPAREFDVLFFADERAAPVRDVEVFFVAGIYFFLRLIELGRIHVGWRAKYMP